MRHQSIADDSSIDHRMTKLEGLVEQLNLRMWSLQGGHKEMSKRMDDMGVRLDWVETVEKTTTVAKKTNGQEPGNALVQPLDWVDIVEKAMTEAQAKVCEVSPNLPSEDLQLQNHDLESKLDSDCHNLVEIVEKAMTKAQAKVCEVSPNLPSEDIQLQSHDLESKLDSDCHNLPDIKSITQTFDSRMESLEKRLFDLADNQLRQQRAGEVQHTEMRLLFTQLQADTTKQQCEQVQQVQQLTSQQLEKAWGVLKAFPGKCRSRETPLSKSVDEPCTPLEPYTPMADDRSQLNDIDYRPSQPGTPLSLKAHRQVLSAIAPSSKGPRASSPTQQPRTSSPPTYMRQSSPRQFDWQPRAGSRSVQLPSRDVSEAATPTIVLSAGRPPPSTSSTSTPRMRSISPRFSGGSARAPPRSPQQPLHNENKLGAPPPQRTSPYQRSTLTAMPANRNALNTRAASPGGPRVHTTQGPLPQQGFRTETVASPLAPFPAPQFISGRSALPGASAVMTPRELIKGGESWM